MLQSRSHVPPCFTMTLYDNQLRRIGDQCCPGVRGCAVCSNQAVAVAHQSQHQQGHQQAQQQQLKKSDSKSSGKESTAQTPEAPPGGAPGGAAGVAGTPAEIEAALAGKNPNKLFGVNPSNIDKYSRVVFPVCFVCFNLAYWVIYLKISDVQYDEPTILH